MGWSTLRERQMKATLRNKVRLERMNETRLARKVYLWTLEDSKWGNKCGKMIDKNSMLVRRLHRSFEDGQNVVEWRMTDGNREGAE